MKLMTIKAARHHLCRYIAQLAQDPDTWTLLRDDQHYTYKHLQALLAKLSTIQPIDAMPRQLGPLPCKMQLGATRLLGTRTLQVRKHYSCVGAESLQNT